MKVIVQRSKNSNVIISGKVHNKIDSGFVLLVSFTEGDNEKNINYLVNKIINLRIFDDENGIMNKSILDTGGSILSISQFTLYANTEKGNRPSYINALNGEKAVELYNYFNKELNSYVEVKTGVFGAEMELNIKNDGPVTIILEK